MVKFHTVASLLLLGTVVNAEAGAWTLQRGQFWGKVTYFQQRTQEWYIGQGRSGSPGTRARYDFAGEYASKAAFIEGFYGVSERLDLGLQIPYFDQSFINTTFTGPRTASGLSDIRIFAKFRLVEAPVLLTIKTGAKMPTGEFRNEDGLIPVGEGQWDFDLVAQLGRSWWPLPLYGNLDLGYRVRGKNGAIDRDPGDEWFLNAELGCNFTRRWMLIGKYEMLRGDPALLFGQIEAEIKRISYLMPVLLYSFEERTVVEIALRVSLNGRNFPAGRQWVLGISKVIGGVD